MNSEDTVRARGVLVERVLRYDTVSFTLGEEGGRGKALNNWSMHKTCIYLEVSVHVHNIHLLRCTCTH